MSIRKIIDMYNDSCPLNNIARHCRLNLKDLFYLLEKHLENFNYQGPPSFPQSRRKEILILYADHDKTISNIANELGHCKKTVSQILKDNNVALRPSPLEYHIDEIVKLAKEGKYATEIAEMYNVNPSSIIRRLKAYGITLQPYKPTIQSQDSARKHHFDKNFFKKVSGEEVAYILNLFATDGNFIKDKSQKKLMGIEILQKRDSEPLLIHVMKALKSDGKPRRVSQVVTYTSKKENKTITEKREYSIASFSSIEMAEDVRKLLQLPKGVKFNKTTDLECPKLPVELEQHGCRAAFDGDGNLKYFPNAKNKMKEKDMSISFYGNKQYLEGIREMVCRHCDVSFMKIKPKEYSQEENTRENEDNDDNVSMYELSWSGRRQVLAILDWIYKDATIYLEEKYQKYKSIDRRKRIVDFSNLFDGPSLYAKRKELGLSQAELAKLISCSSAVISDFEQGKRTTMTNELAKKFIDFFNIEVDDKFFYY